MYKILHTDLETENHPWYGNVASAFNPDNFVVAPGWRVDTVNDDGTVSVGDTHHRYFGKAVEADTGADWFSALDDCAIMVCHNAQFEIKWFLSKCRDTLEAFLKRGGRIACTALAEYLLSHQQELYPSLDETAVKHGGTHKVDGVKILWEQGYLTSQIDRALLIEYLAGPSGDIDNTALTFYSQQQKLAAAGMDRMYWERCDALLAFAYCEWFGLYVDRETAERNLAAQEAEIAELTKQLRGLLPDDLPEDVVFNWGSDYHMSALVYGGPVKYRHRVPYDPPQYVKADFYQTETDGTLVRCDDPLLNQELVAAGQHNFVRFKSGKNKGQVKVFREDTDEEKLKWADTSWMLPGLVNLQSLPAGIKEKYIGKRAEFRGARLLCDGVTPVYSTSTDALKGLKNFVPEVGLMVKLASLEKDTGTYYLREERDADGNVTKTKGMMQYIGPDSIVHHSLNVTATVTGRLSSSNPNLQNLPRDGTSNVKEMFTSRFGTHGRIVEVDYSALEVVMLAALTKDGDLLHHLLNGTDMHCYRLAFKLGEPYEDVLKKCKDESHPQHREYHQMRTDIKPPSFAAQYGATAGGIAFATGCTVEFAQEFLDNEAALFPISIGYRQVIRDEVERTGALPSGIHREMGANGTWQVYRRGYWQSPGGTCYSFRQLPQWKEGREVLDYKATQLANYWCQGEAGFLMSVSMGRICRWLIQNDWFGGKVCLINNVHDACYLDVADEEVGRVAALGVKAIMEDAPKYMTSIWPGYDMADVPFPAAAEWGPNMQHKTHIH